MSRDIEKWLSKFKHAWIEKDIDRVMALFTDKVEYYETPFLKFEDKKQLRDEWETIQKQEDVNLNFEVFNSEDDRFTIIWSLTYTENGNTCESKGAYLIELNSENKCYRFAQYPVTPK